MKAQELEREFGERAVRRGEQLLLTPGDAIALVNRAADEGVPIIAIAGRAVHATLGEPEPGHRVDYSARVAQGHGCWEEAERWLRARADADLAFRIALGDEPLQVV